MHLPHFLIPEILGGSALVFMVIGIYLCRLGSRNQNKYDYLKDRPTCGSMEFPAGSFKFVAE